MDTRSQAFPYRLPEDVWRLILLQVYDDTNEAQFDGLDGYVCPRPRATISLCRVCRLWRDIVLHTSAFWQCVSFEASGVDSLQWFGSFLDYSSTHLIDVYISMTRSAHRTFPIFLVDVLMKLLPHLHRVRSLKVFADRDLPFHNRSFLEFLSMDGHRPELPNTPGTGLPLLELEVLKFHGVHFRSVYDGFLLLRRCPQLKHANITASPDGMHVFPEFSARPNWPRIDLLSLTVATFDAGFLFKLLHCDFHAPALRELTIITSVPRSGVLFLKGRVSDSLHSLSLIGPFDDDFIFHTVLPHLRTLRVSKCDARVFVYYLGQQSASSGFHIPTLELLSTTECQVHDAEMIRLLDAWCPPVASTTLMLEVISCPNTTERLGEELRSRNRGSWSGMPLTQ